MVSEGNEAQLRCAKGSSSIKLHLPEEAKCSRTLACHEPDKTGTILHTYKLLIRNIMQK